MRNPEKAYAGTLLWFRHFVFGAMILVGLLSLGGGIPARAAIQLRSARQSTGYWRFLESVETKADKDLNAASEDVSLSEGNSSLTRTYEGDEPSKYSVDCTWTWSAPHGMARLNPGDMLNGTMTLTDQSELYLTYDGFYHGYSGNTGEISIDQPYIGGAYTDGIQTLLNFSVDLKQSNTVQGQLAVPNGPGWDGKIGLKAKCSWNVYERVYEWVPAGAAAPVQPSKTPATTAPDQSSEPGTGSGGLSWIVIVGGLAVLAAALAAVAGLGIAAALILRRNGKKGPSQQPAQPSYVLQLSARTLDVRVGQSTPLDIQAWRVTPEGATLPAPEAVLQVLLPAASAGLVATPANGQGTLQCAFSAPAPDVCATVAVSVTASAQGIQTSSSVEVRIVPVYALQLEWQDPAQQPQPDGPPVWAWARVNATPPDPQNPPEQITRQVVFSVQGSNSDWIKLQPAVLKNGMQWVQVLAAPPTPGAALQPGNPLLMAQCMAGAESLQAQLKVGLNEDLTFEALVNGQEKADVMFQRKWDPPGWEFTDITTYFHTPEEPNKVVVPSGKYGFPTPPIQADPPVLEVKEFYEIQPGQYGLKVGLIAGIDLEQYLGKDLTERAGLINVTVKAQTGAGKPYQAKVAYQIRPQLELFAHGCDIRGRSYKDLTLGAEEFVADFEDRLCVVIGCCRTDKPEPRDADQIDQVDPAWWNYQASLQGDADTDFQICPPKDPEDKEHPEEGEERTLLIQSKKPLLYKPGREIEKLSLHLEGSATGNLPVNYLQNPFNYDLALKPRFPDLRVWVVPGKQRGTSEAWMTVFLDRNTSQPLRETILKVKIGSIYKASESGLVQSGGDIQDVVASAIAGQVPSLVCYNDKDQALISSGVDGSGQVDLIYRELNWNNYQEALFIVSCTIIDQTGNQESDPVKASVNVKENVRLLLADLFASAEGLKLNNPYWQNRSLGLSSLLDLTVYRPFVRGPIWNICEMISGQESNSQSPDKKIRWKAKFARDYVCSEYRDRIASWLLKRRHYQEGHPEDIVRMSKMNGIEFDNFTLGTDMFHNFEALFLSGMGPEDDPRGLDPWWKQSWQDPAYLEPEGLISSNWERIYALEFFAWFNAGVAPIVIGLLVTGAGGALIVITASAVLLAQAYAVVGGAALNPVSLYSPGKGYQLFKDGRTEYSFVGREVFVKNWVAANPNG